MTPSVARQFFIAVLLICSPRVFAQPLITSFSPLSGAVGSSVTINGSFDPSPANNIVYFGAVRATITAASASQLTATVPAGATFQPITVTSNGLTAFSPSPFIVTFFRNGDEFKASSFDAKVDFSSGTNVGTVALGDIDGDGKADIVQTNQGSNSVTILRNNSSTGDISFDFNTTTLTTGSQPYFAAVGDLDNDGLLDIAVTNFAAASVSVFRNTSTAGNVSFAAKIDFPTGSNPTSVAIRDLDNDGKAEMVVSNSSGNSVSVRRNTSVPGAISFAANVNFTTGGNPNEVALADVDGDGKAEIVTANSSTNTVSILRNTSSAGGLTFAAKKDYPAGTTPKGVAIGDLNGDGKPELAVLNLGSFSSATFSVYRNNCSPGTISFAKNDFSTGGSAQRIAIADMDGNGVPDIATAGRYGSSDYGISVCRNTSTATTLNFDGPDYYLTGNYCTGIALGDLTGDGKPDMVAANFGSSSISVFRNRVADPKVTSFSPSYSGTGNTVTIMGHDFLNVIGVSFGGVPATSFVVNSPVSVSAVVGVGGASGAVAVHTLGGTGSMSGFRYIPPPVIHSFTPDSASVGTTVTITGKHLGTINAAGFGGVPALKVQQHWNDTTAYAIVGNGATGNLFLQTQYGSVSVPGFFYQHPPVVTSVAPAGGPVGSLVTVTGDHFGATIADNTVMIGGNKATIVSANKNSITAIVPKGNMYAPITVTAHGLTTASATPFPVLFDGNNKFDSTTLAPRMAIPLSNRLAECATLGDLDGDGKLDMAVAFSTTRDSVSIYRNTGTGHQLTFAPPLTFGVQYYPDDIEIADLDGDGKQDMVVISRTSTYNFQVFKNTSTPGNISFAPREVLDAAPNGPGTSVVVDVNGDGKPDLVVTNDYGNNLWLMKNTSTDGVISFAPRVSIAATESHSIAAGDLDGDGRPDLVTLHFTNNNIRLIRNTTINGIPSFAPAVDIPVSARPSSLAIGDMDNDGKADIVAGIRANASMPNHLAVLKNLSDTGAFAFANPVTTAVDSVLRCITLADLDGDSYPDVAAIGYMSNNLLLLRNASSASAIALEAPIAFSVWDVPNQKGQPQNIAVGDMNGDGKPDLVVPNYGWSVVNIFPNTIGALLAPCSGGNFTLNSDVQGPTYQWQVDTGNGFLDIADNANYIGANTSALQLTNIPSSWYGYKYRVIGSTTGEVITLKFVNKWTGAANNDWHNPANWSCGKIPDAHSDVVINSGTVVVNADGICRSLTIQHGVVFTLGAGYQVEVKE